MMVSYVNKFHTLVVCTHAVWARSPVEVLGLYYSFMTDCVSYAGFTYPIRRRILAQSWPDLHQIGVSSSSEFGRRFTRDDPVHTIRLGSWAIRDLGLARFTRMLPVCLPVLFPLFRKGTL